MLVGLASVYSAGVAYLVLVSAARQLNAELNAEFLVFWAILFGSFGVVTGVTPESGRAAHDGASQRFPRGALIVLTALGYGAVISSLIATTSLLWGPVVLPNHGGLVLIAAVACFAYSGHLSLWGILTGFRRWLPMSAFMIGESTVRLVAVVVVLATGGSIVALAVASSVSSAAWVIALLWPSVRLELRRRADVGIPRLLRNYLTASAATAASAALTVGFPVLISLTSTTPELLGAAGLMLGISLTRAPLLVPLTAYQGVALAYFLRHRDAGVLALLPMLGLIGAGTVVGALLAWLIGPWLYSLLLGGQYFLSGGALAALVVAAGMLTMLTLAGMCTLALGRHRVFALGWIAATAISVAMLLGPWDLEIRVVLSLVFGPGVGLGIQLVGLRGAATIKDADAPVTSTRTTQR